MLMNVGAVVVPDAKVFSINGARVAAPAAVGTSVPQFDGTIPATGLLSSGQVLDATARYAQLDWGHSTWQASWAFLNAYRMTMILTGKFVLFDELAAHIGACVSAETWGGLGSPNISAASYIRSVNDRQAALNTATTGPRFVPQTIIAGNTPVAAPPPLAPVAYGGPQMDGIFGGWYPTNGILLYPTMPIQINFVRQDNETLYYNRMISNLGQGAEITWDANWSDILTPTGGAATGFSSSFPFKGGILKTGVLMRGCVLAPTACLDWYSRSGYMYDPDSMRALYASAMGQFGQIAQANRGFVGSLGAIDATGNVGVPDVRSGPDPFNGGSYVVPGPGLAGHGKTPSAPH